MTTAVPATPAAHPPDSVGPAATTNQVAFLAGLAWLAAAGLTGLLAFQQYSASASLTAVGLGDLGLGANALFNGIGALLTAYFGARCLRNPPRGFLGTSTAWGVLNVAWGVFQVVNGATYWLFFVIIVATGLAGILSFVARDSAPAKPVP